MSGKKRWLRLGVFCGLGCFLLGFGLFLVLGHDEGELVSLEEVVDKYTVDMLLASDYIGSDLRSNKPRVSVLPFTDFSDAKTGLTGLTSGLVIERLTKSGRVRIFDQSTLDAVTREQQLARDGLANPLTMLRVGKILQPEVLVFGKVEIIDDQGLLMLTLVDPETSEVTWKNSFTFEATPGLRKLDSAKSGSAGAQASEESFWALAKGFFVSNWPWMWTVVLVPAAAWLIQRLAEKGAEEKNLVDSQDRTTSNPD